MKKIFLTSLLLVNIAFTQDIIKKNNGEIIETKVTEIEDLNVKYKKHSNQTGPTYSIAKDEISYILYENGEKETFTQKTTTENNEIKSYNTYTKKPNEKTTTNDNESTNEGETTIVNPPTNDGVDIGIVKKLSGVDVYCLNKPLLKYSVVYNSASFLSDLDAKTILTGGLSTADVNEKMIKLINLALKKGEKEGVTFDAVIYTGGKSILAIKYETNEIPSEVLAKVTRVNGIALYAFCDPVNTNYEIINKGKAKSGGLMTVGTYGLVGTTIEDNLTKMIERLDGGKKSKINAVIYSTGKTGIGININE